MTKNRVDLTQPLPALDDYEDDWLDEEDGAWDDGISYDSESEPEPEEEPAPRRNRRDRDNDQRTEKKSSKGGLFKSKAQKDDIEEPRKTARNGRKDRKAQEPAPAKQPTGQTSALTDLLLLIFKIGLIVVFLLVLFTFFYGITQVRDTSMEPAVKEGDLVIYYRPDKDYAAGDAIVVEYNGSLQVRRVVATAGDTVDISSDGGLIVNGSTQIENDIYTTTLPYTEGITFPVTVGTGEVFVLGDDRTSATDSRIYGTVAVDATKGAVMTVIRRRGI